VVDGAGKALGVYQADRACPKAAASVWPASLNVSAKCLKLFTQAGVMGASLPSLERADDKTGPLLANFSSSPARKKKGLT